MTAGPHPTGSDDPGPTGVIERLTRAWNAADATAFARLFTEDATLVIWLGDALTGRPEIEQVHGELFATRPGTMHLSVVHTRLVDDNSAVVLSIAGVGRSQSSNYDKLQTSLMVRRDGCWMIAAAQVTAMSERSKQHYNDRLNE